MSPKFNYIKKEIAVAKRIEKWHSIGNDFLITENEFTKEEILILSDRKFGIGCDQFIIQSGVFIKIFNSDGSSSEMCGNALKCLAVKYFKKTGKSKFSFFISEIEIKVFIEEEVPCILFPLPTNFTKKPPSFNLECETGKSSGSEYDFLQVLKTSMFFYAELGNPHLICILNENQSILSKEDMFAIFCTPGLLGKVISEIGENIQKQFPKTGGINLSFSLKTGEDTIFIRTFERGVGETLSCSRNLIL
jgi:diaminopimelate epimerase